MALDALNGLQPAVGPARHCHNFDLLAVALGDVDVLEAPRAHEAGLGARHGYALEVLSVAGETVANTPENAHGCLTGFGRRKGEGRCGEG